MPTLIIPGAFTRASSFDRLAALLGAEVVELPLRTRRLPQLDVGGLRAADRALDREIDRVRRRAHADTDRSPLVLVGHSMGGLLALRASRRHDLDALVLLMPTPPGGLLPDVARLLVRDPASAVKFAALSLSTLPVRSGRWGTPPRGLYTAGVTAEVLAETSRHRADESLAVLLQLVVGSRRRVDPTDVPTLVIGGRDDGLVPAATVQRLADQLDAEHLELPVAHNFSEEPAGVVVEDAVRRWLRGQHVHVRSSSSRQ